MATRDISTNGRRKTMLIYRDDGGLALRQVDTRSQQSREIPLTASDLDAIAAQWPTFRQSLSNADVQLAEPATRYPSTDKASPVPANSPSSPK